MILKNSRYYPLQPFAADEAADAAASAAATSGAAGAQVFPGVLPRKVETAEGAIEYEVKSGDRLDLLARNFYNQDRLWWRILDANPDLVYAGTLLSEEMVGQVILIPKAKD